MKQWQQRLLAVISGLGFTNSAKAGKLTDKEQKQIFLEYKKKYGIEFAEDKAKNSDAKNDYNQLLSKEESNQ